MGKLLDRLRAATGTWWIKFIRALNYIAAGVGTLAIALNTMYPDAVKEVSNDLPAPAKFAILAVWVGIIHYATGRAKKA